MLGKELELDLVMVFIGLWCEWEIPRILETYGLIDEFEATRLYALIETSDDLDLELGPVVRKAYLDYYNPSGLSV
ncbi:MAG: hypothetical protein ACI9DC_004245 [Gammaproteobacteria bacterium]